MVGSLPTMELTRWTVFSQELPLSCPRLSDQCCSQISLSPPHFDLSQELVGLPRWFRQYRICPQYGRPRLNPQIRKISWRREWLPTSVFLLGKPHGQRSLASYSSWGCKESDMTEQLTHTHRSQSTRKIKRKKEISSLPTSISTSVSWEAQFTHCIFKYLESHHMKEQLFSYSDSG